MTIQRKTPTMLDQGAAVRPQLYRLLRERIIRNEIEPGARISESEIAAEYSISRQPVREAFIKLAEEGLVEVRPQRGTFVCKISVPAVMDARFVREAIEADIVKLLAAAQDKDLERMLRGQLDDQSRVADKDSVRFISLDEQFHRTLAEAAGKSHAWSVIENVKAQMNRVRHLATRRFPIEALVDQHRAVVDAIAKGDVVAAEAAMRGHLRAILTDLPEVARDRPEFFEGTD